MCPTRDKKLTFICEKELLMVDVVEDTDGEETKEGNHNEEEHLGKSDLPICVIQQVLMGTKRESSRRIPSGCTPIFSILI